MKGLIELLDKENFNEEKEIIESSINYILNVSLEEFRKSYFSSNSNLSLSFDENEITFRNLIKKLNNNDENEYFTSLDPSIFHGLMRERDQQAKVGFLLSKQNIWVPNLTQLTTSDVLNKINEIKQRPLLEKEIKSRKLISKEQLENIEYQYGMEKDELHCIKRSPKEKAF